LIADITADLGRSTPAVVVIDTLNRTINGSENKDEDMGRFIKWADTIQRAFGCVVVIIHHSGVSGDRPRGHTSLSGANDAQIAVERNDSGLITMTVEGRRGWRGNQVAPLGFQSRRRHGRRNDHIVRGGPGR
jgi:RecA-family ATPase